MRPIKFGPKSFDFAHKGFINVKAFLRLSDTHLINKQIFDYCENPIDNENNPIHRAIHEKKSGLLSRYKNNWGLSNTHLTFYFQTTNVI